MARARVQAAAAASRRDGREARRLRRPAAPHAPAPLLSGAATPKYLQVAEQVVADLKSGRLSKGDRLPSINEAARRSRLSRDTVVKAYARLEEQRLVSAVHGKGYFLRAEAADLRVRTFVLFDAFTAYKEELFAGLVERVAGRAELDVWFHHFNPVLFRRLLLEARGRYDRYVVMPFPAPEVREALAALELERLLVLDILAELPDPRCSYVVQSFDAQLMAALESGLARLRRYRRLTLVFPPDRHHPEQIPAAFRRFGAAHHFPTTVVPRLAEDEVQPDTAYLVIEDGDLVNLVKWCARTGHRLGRDVGVISYNDTPLKEVVAGGISVVSTDFHALGARVGEHLLAPGPVQEVRPTQLVVRSSL